MQITIVEQGKTKRWKADQTNRKQSYYQSELKLSQQAELIRSKPASQIDSQPTNQPRSQPMSKPSNASTTNRNKTRKKASCVKQISKHTKSTKANNSHS